MKWRLGLDIGSNSIGWAVLELNQKNRPVKLINSGSRIFSNSRDPKANKSLAEQRRGPRGARRNRDRYKIRRREFMGKLTKHGLMPKEKAARKSLENYKKGEPKTIEKDPWVLRYKALEEKISLYEFGRALFHLQQRRGFKSNRKTDKADNEKGAISEAAKNTIDLIEEKDAKTLGQAFAAERVKQPKKAHLFPVRARPHGEGTKLAYDIYPQRNMIEQEFIALWGSQQKFHGSDVLSIEMRDDLLNTLLYQRPLKAQPIGKCTLDPSDQRAPSCLPSQQQLRIYQEINILRILTPGQDERPLTVTERNLLVTKLINTEKPKFTALRKVISLPSESYFNLESDKRKDLKGDCISAIFKKDEYWGKVWFDLPLNQQDAVVEILNGCEPNLPNKQENPVFKFLTIEIASALDITTEKSSRLLQSISEQEIANWLEEKFQLSTEQALKVANAPSHVKWPQGHGRLGRRATKNVLGWLKSDQETSHNPETGELYQAPFIYSEAAALAGFNHSELDKKNNLPSLPYYGKVLDRQVAFGSGDPNDKQEIRYGKIANPTVHVALNQVRKVINELIKVYGKPEQIIVETARDLPLSAEGRKELESEQKSNQNKNKTIAKKLAECGVSNNYENRLKYQLWEELDENVIGRCCPFSGDHIGLEKCLFSSEIEIEHILPYSQTGDDSKANKTLATKKANRLKGNRSPYDAFGQNNQSGYQWEDIVARSTRLPKNKRWRFNPDAMDRYANEDAFQDRHLNDTRYISRITKTYLTAIGADVWVTPGKLTSDLRHQWGLNSILAGHNSEETQQGDTKKNRNDHRHHAIDAIVVGLTDRTLLKDVATEAASGRVREKSAVNLINGLDLPWVNFRDDVRTVIDKLIVSHKADHGLQGQLHNDTAYGVIKENIDGKGKSEVVHRIPLSSITKPEKLDQIRDEDIKAILIKKTEGLSGKDFTETLQKVGEEMTPPVRRIRIKEKLKVIPFNDKQTEKILKAYKGDNNYCYEIYDNGKGVWTGDIIQRFHANQKNYDPKSKNSQTGFPLIMRLHNNDMIAMLDRENNKETIFRIVKMSLGKITVAKHYESNVDSRDRDNEEDYNHWTMSPSSLQKQIARKVRVNAIGTIYNT